MTTTTPPPAAAVAKDAHWASKMERLRNRTPQAVTLVFPDPVAADRLTQAQNDDDAARREVRIEAAKVDLDADPSAEEIEADPRVQATLQAMRDAEAYQLEVDVRMTVQAIPSDVYADLAALHPPTEDQENRGELAYNVDRFAPALIAACCTDDMTDQEAAELIGGQYLDEKTGEWVDQSALLNQGEAAWLFQSCVRVNSDSRIYLTAAGKE